MWRVVIRPWWLRPPDLLCFSSRGACGAPLCRSGVTTRTALRRPAEVGLNVINGIGPSSGLDRHHVDRLAVGQRHVRLAPVAAGALAAARSEERRVGTECANTCRSRWSPPPSKTNT